MTEPKRPNFQKRTVPQPPPPAAAGEGIPTLPAPGGTGTLPMSGVVLSDHDKQQLTHIGWSEGDAIPPDFAQRIKAAQQQAAAATSQAHADLVEEGRQKGGRVKVGKNLNLEDLPEDQQKELGAVLTAYQEHVRAEQVQRVAARRQEARVVANADPSVAQAHRATLAAQDAQPALPDVEIKMPEPSFPPELQPREGAEVGNVENVSPFVTQPGAPRVEPVAEPVVEPEPAPVLEAGGTPAVTHCPRCLWVVEQPWEIEPTDDDKHQFVGAILGGTRFTRTVPVLGGKLLITFRSLTSQETDLCFKQLGIDTRKERIFDDGQYFMQLQVYRLAMSVERIDNGRQECIVEMPPVFDIELDPEEPPTDETPLIKLVDWFNAEVVSQESMRRIVAQHHRQFQRLVEGLEAMTSEADFWKGIK